jgi:hypothetical protein
MIYRGHSRLTTSVCQVCVEPSTVDYPIVHRSHFILYHGQIFVGCYNYRYYLQALILISNIDKSQGILILSRYIYLHFYVFCST